VATAAALYFATSQFNILDLLVFVGALWGCLVFPVIASFYWPKVTNAAFTAAVIAALVAFLPVRFEWIPFTGATGFAVELLATVGIGVVLGIMAFGFFGLKPAVIVGALATVVALPFTLFFLRDYTVLSASLVAYSVSFLVCYLMSFRSKRDFDFSTIKDLTGDFDPETVQDEASPAGTTLAGQGAAPTARND